MNVSTVLDFQQTKEQRKSLTSENKQASNQRQHRDGEGTAESHEWDDEGDDEDDEAYDHQSSDRLSPCWRDNEEQDFYFTCCFFTVTLMHSKTQYKTYNDP